MSLYKSKERIINTERFNLEACEKVQEELNNPINNKIIVTGERYSGKTTTLESYAKTTINNKNQAIYIEANKYNYEPYLTDRELKYKYELLISCNLINHIKYNYPKQYEKKYKNIELDLLKELKRFSMYKKSIFDKEQKINLNYTKEKILTPLIGNIKNDLNIDKLTIILDQFDWVGNSSARYQKMMNKYLELFDKHIITTDDISVREDKQRKKELTQKGYEITTINYGLDHKIVKDIITKDLNYWQKNKRVLNNKLNINFQDIKNIISNETYNLLIDRSNGDINSIFEAIKPYYEYNYMNFTDIDNNILKFQEDYLIQKEEIERKLKVKKLHL